MPLIRARALTGRNRSAPADRQIGITLAFVAGAIDVGGFLAVRQYTSHMTGIVSAAADNVTLGAYQLAAAGLAALFAFVFGAACSAAMVNYARRHRMHSEYALPLLVESFLLLGFGLLGPRLERTEALFVPFAVVLLCFTMGLQNAVITKLSNAVIRTTHITGIVTDIGIELGKLCYWNGHRTDLLPKVHANPAHLRLLSLLALFFFGGGMAGAVGFKAFGYIATVPLAIVLIGLAGVPAYDDLSAAWRRRTGA